MTDARETQPSLDAVLAQVRRDAAAGLLEAWGCSTVIDELVGTAVVDRPIVDALHAAAALPARFPLGNAGLLHVYGYWFSVVETPFGRKRDRWLDGQLARALGQGAEAFLLEARDGTTLLERVTRAVLPVLAAPDAAAHVVDEQIGGVRARTVLRRAPGAEATALVYGIDAGDGLRLVTAFPVADARTVVDELAEAPRLRWNAAVVPEP